MLAESNPCQLNVGPLHCFNNARNRGNQLQHNRKYWGAKIYHKACSWGTYEIFSCAQTKLLIQSRSFKSSAKSYTQPRRALLKSASHSSCFESVKDYSSSGFCGSVLLSPVHTVSSFCSWHSSNVDLSHTAGTTPPPEGLLVELVSQIMKEVRLHMHFRQWQ